MYEYRHQLKKTGFVSLYTDEPEEDWSGVLWRLARICFEAGMTREEVFVIASNAKCNKYERDKRPLRHLWLDIIKADTIDRAYAIITGEDDPDIEFPVLVTEEEIQFIEATFI